VESKDPCKLRGGVATSETYVIPRGKSLIVESIVVCRGLSTAGTFRFANHPFAQDDTGEWAVFRIVRASASIIRMPLIHRQAAGHVTSSIEPGENDDVRCQLQLVIYRNRRGIKINVVALAVGSVS
jgi:hypothetical protein